MSRGPKALAGHPLTFEEARTLQMNRAVIERVVDGDTFWALTDLGRRQYLYEEIRLWGADAYELHRGTADERARGAEAKQTAERELAGRYVLLLSHKDPEKYGRYLEEVYVLRTGADGEAHWTSFVDVLAALGLLKRRTAP